MGDAHFDISAELKNVWGLLPQQGCATAVEELIMPDSSRGTIHRAVARTGQNLDADTESTQDKSLSLRSQWAADLAEMRSECGASCACRRAKTGPVFVLPTPKK
jgi:hypothetical protein